ncbi:MAG TPA: 4-demethylwyosine synthase TYW1 [Candidatus Nanoarchaeia archaeon]|nr:4-demethylwyosine synthase TYW1 [Candidatus Nanoarchaeia archaeon]
MMLTPSARKELEKQQYRIIGSHSAVKICGWTKKRLRGQGNCYKHAFYGINSGQCLQMTTCLSCANRCVFCWRGFKAPVSRSWEGTVDDPERILKESLIAQHNLLTGFNGSDSVNKKDYATAQEIKHVALSLNGEPILYPRINELLDLCDKRGISTFLVTNAQYPEAIKNLAPVTQLYLSIDAPTPELLKRIDVPLFPDHWERMEESLEELSRKKHRTAVRLTIIKGMNDVLPERYAALILKGDPDFIEAKGYMFVGASRQHLSKENMPFHEEIVEFSKRLAEFLPEYEIVTEHIPSRAVMLAKKSFKKKGRWKTWIDFGRWHKLAAAGKDPAPEEFLKLTPKVGLSGRGTKERFDEK